MGTLARGLDILELFAGDSPELTQTEISERLGLPVPTVHRLVKLLSERGWLVRDPASRRLRLGLGAARLLPAVRLPELAREPLRALAERTGETVNLATLDGDEVLYLLSETGSHLLTLRSHVGLRLPVHATALGKCLLAQLGDDDARGAAGREPYDALTPKTVTTWASCAPTWSESVAKALRTRARSSRSGSHSVAVPLDWMAGDGPVAVNVSLPVVARGPRGDRQARARAEDRRGADHGRGAGSGRVSAGTTPSGSTRRTSRAPRSRATSRPRSA